MKPGQGGMFSAISMEVAGKAPVKYRGRSIMVSTVKRRLPGAGLPGCAFQGICPYGALASGQVRIESLACGGAERCCIFICCAQEGISGGVYRLSCMYRDLPADQ